MKSTAIVICFLMLVGGIHVIRGHRHDFRKAQKRHQAVRRQQKIEEAKEQEAIEQKRKEYKAIRDEEARRRHEVEAAKERFRNSFIWWNERALLSSSEVGSVIAHFIKLNYIRKSIHPLIVHSVSEYSVGQSVQIKYVYRAIDTYSSRVVNKNEFYRECEKILYKTLER